METDEPFSMADDSFSSWISDRPNDLGGSHTNWSIIYEAARGKATDAVEAWEQLVRRYWPAIYAYNRSNGCSVHQASDLTQGFVCDVLMGRDLLGSADPARGRFRTLLQTALRNYLVERHRHAERTKRSPKEGQLVRLDVSESSMIKVPTGATPEEAFAAQWSATLVRRVLDQVQAECQDEGLETHWLVFELRVVRPLLMGGAPVTYADLVDRFGLKDAAQGGNMMITVKRRFARALLEEVGRTVARPSQIDDELYALLRALEKPG